MTRLIKIFLLIFLLVGAIAPVVAQAADPAKDIRNLELNVPLGDLKQLSPPTTIPDEGGKSYIVIPWIAEYVGAAFRYGLLLGSALAVLMIMIGGISYILAGANMQMLDKAKGMMWQSVIGLVVLMLSYMVLNIVNPNLVVLPSIKIETVKIQNLTVGEAYCKEVEKMTDCQISSNYSKTAVCGTVFEVSAKAGMTGAVCPSKCISNYCEDATYSCIQSPIHGSLGKCERALVFGDITDYSERFLDYLWLYGYTGKGRFDNLYSVDTSDGMKQYKIPYSNDLAAKLKEYQFFVLKIELNDTGKQRSDYDTISKVGQFVFNEMGASGTVDDDYYVGLPADSLGLPANTGIWMDFCEFGGVLA